MTLHNHLTQGIILCDFKNCESWAEDTRYDRFVCEKHKEMIDSLIYTQKGRKPLDNHLI